MKIKKKQIRPALDALRSIKLQKVKDTKMRKAIVGTYVDLTAAWHEFESKRKAIEEAQLDAYSDEREEVGRLQQELQVETDRFRRKDLLSEINGHKELFAAVRDYNRDIDTLGNEEVEISGISKEKFLAAIEDQEYDLGILEAIHPLYIVKA